MKIEIKKSKKPIKYRYAINFLEKRLLKISNENSDELIWLLKHPSTYTAGTSYNKSEILDKSIKIIKTSRGGKITWHGPGQMICYLVINLNKRKKDIRKFLNVIENKKQYSKSDTTFYHNPYVNKMWSEIKVYTLSEKK